MMNKLVLVGQRARGVSILLEPLCKTGSDLKSSPAFHNLGPTVEVRWGSDVNRDGSPADRKFLIGEVLLR